MDSKKITGINLLKQIDFDEDFDSVCSKINNSEIIISNQKKYISIKNIYIFDIPTEMIIYFNNQKLSYIDFEIDVLKTACLINVNISSRENLWEFICKLIDDTYIKLKDKYPSLDISKNEYGLNIKCEDCVIEMSGETRDKEQCIVSIREKR